MTGIPTPPAHPRPLILVVDDEDMIRTLVRSLLESHGYQVLEAENGYRAAELLETELDRVDLVITDVRMPGLTGPELVKQLREERPRLPIIYISGYVGDAMWDEEPNRITDYLAKPFTLPNLLAAVRRLTMTNRVPA